MRKHRSGLVLLVVLGMLGLFTLLAVTYLSISSQSRNAGQALVRAKLQKMPTENFDTDIIRKIIRGDTSNQSGFYSHGLLEDIYGRSTVRGAFVPSSAVMSIPSVLPPSSVRIMKVQLNPSVVVNRDVFRIPGGTEDSDQAFLSVEDDIYTGRLITFLEGPLLNQTYRILGYRGNVSNPPGFAFSIAIDLAETDKSILDVPTTANPTVTSQMTLSQLLATSGDENRLIQLSNTQPFAYIINDVPFNGIGIGVERDPTHPNYGNLDQSRWVPGTELNTSGYSSGYKPGMESFPISLLPNYDYLGLSNSGAIGTWKPSRTVTVGPQLTSYNSASTSFEDVIGSSNEGFDVPDYHDHWLAFQAETNEVNSTTGRREPLVQSQIIPSYHRPELVNYIANYMNGLTGGTTLENQLRIIRLITLIDYACSRPLGYSLRNCPAPYPKDIKKDVGFTGRIDSFAIPTLDIDVGAWPSNTSDVTAVQNWVAALTAGNAGSPVQWDVDNDADGVADSVWVVPNLPLITSPEGKHLKVLAANLILDLDGRLNVNAAGDQYHVDASRNANQYQTRAFKALDNGFGRVIPGMTQGAFLPQGLGFGPADISLASLDRTIGSDRVFDLQQLFQLRNGRDQLPGLVGNDNPGRYYQQREVLFDSNSVQYGLKQARRSRNAIGTDILGNPRMSDANNVFVNDELIEDAYELAQRRSLSSDEIFSVNELETLLRRFDQDASQLPERLRKVIADAIPNSHVVFKAVTTRSAELRYPPQAGLSRHMIAYSNANFPSANNSAIPLARATIANDINGERLVSNEGIEGSLLRWIQLLYQERNPGKKLELAQVRELFPLEFRKGLRLDINRAFGNGQDDDNDGQIDEPEELNSVVQRETVMKLNSTYQVNGQYGFGYPSATSGTDPAYAKFSNASQSRRMLARQLYCLAQLIVPDDHEFAGRKKTDTGYIKYRARELAQWSVNIVDFRDTDCAMTRFEYDETPFNNVWKPLAGNVVWGMEFPELLMMEILAFHDKRTKDTDRDDDKGTKIDVSDPTMKDQTTDQYRMPQGSLFFELMCPRSPNSPDQPTSTASADLNLGTAPSSLYTNNGTLWLSKRAPVSATYGRQPVFRIGITRRGSAVGAGTPTGIPDDFGSKNLKNIGDTTNQTSAVSVQNIGQDAYDSSGLIENISWLPTPPAPNPPNQTDVNNPLKFERMVWFTGYDGDSVPKIPDLTNESDPNRRHRIFFNKQNSAQDIYIPGGGYLVVGPRTRTFIGSRNDVTLPPIHVPSMQKVELHSNYVDMTDIFTGNSRTQASPAGSLPSNWTMPTTRTMVAVAQPPGTAQAAWDQWIQPVGTDPPTFEKGKGVGLNVSEPLPVSGNYYTMPTSVVNPTAPVGSQFPHRDGYADFTTPAKTLPDVPFDHDDSATPWKNDCLKTEMKHLVGTYLHHRIAYLQRLADPDFEYHPIYNPYITIDWMSIDLTVFNGEDTKSQDPLDNPGPQFAFASRYKDGASSNNPSSVSVVATQATDRRAVYDGSINIETGISLLSASTAEMVKTNPVDLTNATGPTNAYFPYSLGTINVSAAPLTALPTFPNADSVSSVSLGFTNAGRIDVSQRWDGFGEPAPNTTGNYQGASQLPQSGLFWLNRPFTNPSEIMLVPKTAPGQFSMYVEATKTTDLTLPNKYGTQNATDGIFGYLPSFFNSEALETSTATQANGSVPARTFWQQRDSTSGATGTGSNLSLLLELVETAPPFVDSDRFVDAHSLDSSTDQVQQNLLQGYLPPFNRFPSYVKTGKVNMNTIAYKEVWDAIEWNFDNTIRLLPANASNWRDISNARRGYAIGSDNGFLGGSANPNLHAQIPTQFAAVFRSGFSSNLDASLQPGSTGVMPLGRVPRTIRPVQTGLLRSDIFAPPGQVDRTMLFAADPNSQTLNGDSANRPPAPDLEVARIRAESVRQPFVDMQRLMRLSNLVTNQSNVFAVWVTVGLFEYDEIDGIGAEYIGPSGKPERTKSFYIIDRSIPVGFAPGKSYNSDKTILLRRKIPR